MSQFARLSRGPAASPARPVRASPERPPARRGGQLAARLRKLAAAGSTGSLPLSGTRDGTIHLRDGQVTGAESSGTPGPGTGLAPRPLASVPAAGDQSPLPEATMVATLTLLEPTVDAVLDLVVSEANCGRFRPARGPAAEPPVALPVETLLAEIARRERLLDQLAAAVAPDTTVTRNPRISAPRIQVTTLQWALLIRARAGTTPRDLAFALGRSVFGTTAEVGRLMTLRLLSAAGDPEPGNPEPGNPEPGDPEPGGRARGVATVSFIRALPD
jgi:hypothetical protein